MKTYEHFKEDIHQVLGDLANVVTIGAGVVGVYEYGKRKVQQYRKDQDKSRGEFSKIKHAKDEVDRKESIRNPTGNK